MPIPRPVDPALSEKLARLSRLYRRQRLPGLRPDDLAQDELGELALRREGPPGEIPPEAALDAAGSAEELPALTERVGRAGLPPDRELASMARLQADHPGLAASLEAFGEDTSQAKRESEAALERSLPPSEESAEEEEVEAEEEMPEARREPKKPIAKREGTREAFARSVRAAAAIRKAMRG